MEKKTIEVIVAKKAEGDLDPAKQGKEAATPPTDEDVGGRSVGGWVECPHCGSMRYVFVDFEGEWFTCGNCNQPFRVWV
jgi:hypothetical protein